MSFSGSDSDGSPVSHRKSMLKKDILDIGEELESFSNSTASLPFSNKEKFLNLMKGLEISYGVNIISGIDINVVSVDSDVGGFQVDVFKPLTKVDEAIGGGNEG